MSCRAHNGRNLLKLRRVVRCDVHIGVVLLNKKDSAYSKCNTIKAVTIDNQP